MQAKHDAIAGIIAGRYYYNQRSGTEKMLTFLVALAVHMKLAHNPDAFR